jgi:hypothetical protein
VSVIDTKAPGFLSCKTDLEKMPEDFAKRLKKYFEVAWKVELSDDFTNLTFSEKMS